MVYLDDFEEFEAASSALFQQSPMKTRYLIKYRHQDGKAGRNALILKVTNNAICLKFRTNEIGNLKLVERFSQSYARWMVTKDLSTVDAPDEELKAAKEENKAKPKAQGAKKKTRKG
eukprot:TRINITY_DN8735_c0_g1_i2.p1 TRINITY_DN8735_c0_g1~~TRINITY_DN8735_c0_g1_i2.p1  ORF type:complete len:117 (+),score=32.56 TRINITY_DN8735_c0_g1_i2:97-447(+)